MAKRAPDPYRSVPLEIRSLVAVRNILTTEDPKQYDALFSALTENFRPKDIIGWLDLKKLQDLMWDYFRLSRIKPEILNSERKNALASLFKSMVNNDHICYLPSGEISNPDKEASAYFVDPEVKERIDVLLNGFNYSSDTLDAVAFIEREDALLTLERLQTWNDARQYVVRSRFERNGWQLVGNSNDNEKHKPAKTAKKTRDD